MIAKKQIHGNVDHPTLLISCPEKFLIGPGLAFKLFGNVWEENPHIRQPLIKLAFLYEVFIQGSKSVWETYFGILPDIDEINMPTAWTEKELDWLKGSNLYGNVETRKMQWDLELDDLKAYVEDFDWKAISTENYYWASSIFLSRAFPARVIYDSDEYHSEELNLSMLIPVLDSLNHKPETSVFWKANTKKFEFSVGYNVDVGQEIFNNYGPKGNEEFLTAYGFCLDTHMYDLVTLRLLLPPVEGISEAALKYGLEINEGYIVTHLSQDAPLNIKLLNLFTLLSRKSEELNGVVFKNSAFSRVDKMKGCQSLTSALEQKYEKLEQEKLCLSEEEQASLNPLSKKRYQCAQIYKAGQEQILKKSLISCDQLLQDLVAEAEVRISMLDFFKDEEYDVILREALGLSSEEDLFGDEGNGDMSVVIISVLEKLKGKDSKINLELENVWIHMDENEYNELSNPEEYQELFNWCDFENLKKLDIKLAKYLESKDLTPKLLAEAKHSIAANGFWRSEEEFMFLK